MIMVNGRLLGGASCDEISVTLKQHGTFTAHYARFNRILNEVKHDRDYMINRIVTGYGGQCGVSSRPSHWRKFALSTIIVVYLDMYFGDDLEGPNRRKPCGWPHWRVTSQDMALRCAMAAHLEAGKEYGLSALVVNANGNCATCKGTISKSHLFAACPCGQTEVRLLSREGEFNAGRFTTPDTLFAYHNTPEGEPCEHGGSKVATAHAHEAFFAHLAAGINRLD